MIGSKRPHSYLNDGFGTKNYFAKKMSRHLIPVGGKSGVWHRDVKKGFTQFITERNDMICRALEEEAGIRLFRRDL